MDFSLLVISGILLIAIVIIIYCMARLRKLHAENGLLRESIETESKKRVEKSRAVILGQVTEHFAPILPGFGYNPKDARFIGQPVDYLIFNGLNDEEDPQSRVSTSDAEVAATRSRSKTIEVVFCEIKSGESRLSPTERAIRDAIEAGRVRFEIMRLAPNGSLEIE